MKVNYTVSAEGQGSFSESAEAVFLISRIGDSKSNVIIAGEIDVADAAVMLFSSGR